MELKKKKINSKTYGHYRDPAKGQIIRPVESSGIEMEKKVKMTEQGKKNFVYEQKSTETSLIHRIK